METVLPPEFRKRARALSCREGSRSGEEDVVSSHAETSVHKTSVVIGRIMAAIAGVVIALFLIASLIATAVRIFG